MKSNRRVNTAATMQAVYLVWLFFCITTMCNLSVFRLVRGKFPESFTHAQAVDTRPVKWTGGLDCTIESVKWTGGLDCTIESVK